MVSPPLETDCGRPHLASARIAKSAIATRYFTYEILSLLELLDCSQLVSLTRIQVLMKEIIHAVPGIVQHVRPVEIVKFTRIHPKRK